MKPYNHAEIEAFARQYWGTHKTYQNLKEKQAYNPPFMFLDGPPYTSGKVHIGTALNKCLKDMVLRIKRMQGYAVFDRAGYDMHGLPTEQPTMKRLGLHTREDIEKYGVDKFIEACKDWCVSNMREMNEAFARLGVWMDFENAYQPISREYISGVWMLIARAYEKGRLYEGLRTMAWDPVFQTACAKHELEYETVHDTSIYVKFKLTGSTGKKPRYLVIWTTTPWTIPFNLAVMVHPEIEYAVVDAGQEEWIVASDLRAAVEKIVGHELPVSHTLLGAKLEGAEYMHPFSDRLPYASLKSKHPKVHSVVLSSEYVDTSAGTGLVHCAPGCGPEDYEVGVQNNLPAYNTVNTDGTFEAPFEGLRARIDDARFIEEIAQANALVAKARYTHDYPHSERSKAAVIYRTTTQWFFKVNDLREEMLRQNETIFWQPRAAHNAFASWLQNLRDNSITKQRFWGTPVPIWKNEHTGEIIVVGSVSELESLSGKSIADAHKPWIDEITIPSKKHPGTVLHRIPDVLDVWVDAGSASWNAIDYPQNTSLLSTHYPADFILEGKDQIRGWFNLLMVAGMLALDKPGFKAVYMHGYINDSQGRKMSKSLGNYITPDEVLPKFGVDTFRLSMIGGGTPGLDISYGQEAITTAYRDLGVLWNTMQYLVDLCATHELKPRVISTGDEEERFMLSRMESTLKTINEAIAYYALPEIPRTLQQFWLELSRTYIQVTREKSQGEEKQLVADLLYTCLRKVVVLLAPVCPFTAESMWQEFVALGVERGSVHEQNWPEQSESLRDESLEKHFDRAQELITASLSCREMLKIGVRWPLETLVITVQQPLEQFSSLIARQVNVRSVQWRSLDTKKVVKPQYGALGKSFGRDTQKVAKLIEERQPHPPFNLEGYEILPEHVTIHEEAPQGYASASVNGGAVYLQSAVTQELLEEGYARELMRRVQAARKDLGLQKVDFVAIHFAHKHALSAHHLSELMRKCNATLADHRVGEERHENIRDRTYSFSIAKIPPKSEQKTI